LSGLPGRLAGDGGPGCLSAKPTGPGRRCRHGLFPRSGGGEPDGPGALDVPEKGQRMEGSGRTGGSALGPGRGGDARGIRPREIRRAEEGSSMLAARWHGQRDVRVEDIPEVGSPPEGWVKVKV